MARIAASSEAKKLIVLDRRAPYLEAAGICEAEGLRLPPNALLQSVLQRPHGDILSHHGRKGAWARELLAYPGLGGCFKKGTDLVDHQTGWVLPARYIPKEACGKERMCLFIVPGKISMEGRRLVLHPESAIILHPFVGGSGTGIIHQGTEFEVAEGHGRFDDATAVPLEIVRGVFKYMCGTVTRVVGEGIRPIARNFVSGMGGHLNANRDPRLPEEVIGVSDGGTSTLGTGTVSLREMLSAAADELDGPRFPRERLVALRDVIDSLLDGK